MNARSLRLSAALVATVLCSASCRYEPDGAVPLEVPSVYRQWWAELERCAERTANFERITFWKVKGETFPCPKGPCAGRWQSPHHVYIAERWIDNPSLVKHEMLHDLLRTGEHPQAYFGPARCNVSWDPPHTSTDT